jgi:hypothetical protein
MATTTTTIAEEEEEEEAEGIRCRLESSTTNLPISLLLPTFEPCLMPIITGIKKNEHVLLC